MSGRERVRANGLEFAYHRAGDGDRLALCLHGFPDDAGSLAPLADRLADAGLTAVCPYMRGYGPTEAAPDGDYSVGALAADAVALADRLCARHGCSEAVLVGHDWGAVAGYEAGRRAPERFERLVAMAVPPRFGAALLAHPRQVARSWYAWLFQLPGVERLLRARTERVVRGLWELWSPGWAYDPDRLAAVVGTLQSPGTLAAAVAYYRAYVRRFLAGLVREGVPAVDDPPLVGVPGVVLAGERDRCIGPRTFDRARAAFGAEARLVRVPDAGHFMHRERPAAVGRLVVEACA